MAPVVAAAALIVLGAAVAVAAVATVAACGDARGDTCGDARSEARSDACGGASRRDFCLVAEYGGVELFAWPILAGDMFEVTYTHSLNRSPVTDVIEWTGEELSVVKSIFKTFGAGIPLPEDVGGAELLFAGDHYELVGMDRRMRGFHMLVQEAPDQRVAYDGHEARLLELAGSGASVYITVRLL